MVVTKPGGIPPITRLVPIYKRDGMPPTFDLYPRVTP